MRIVLVVLAASGALAGSVVLAQSGPEVLKAKGCNNCHEADKKKVGPSYKELAARGGDAKAIAARLKDAKGHPKVSASEPELNAAVRHILSMQ